MEEKITFHSLELTYNNLIQVRCKVQTGNVIENLRSVTDSREDLSEAPQLIQDIAAAFPYAEFENPDGPCSHADFIRVLDGDRSQVRYNITEYVYQNQTEVLKAVKMRPVLVDCLENLSEHSAKIQKFCAIIFTDEVKAKFIASLPRVKNAAKSERVRMHKKIHEDGEHVEIVQVEEEINDDGELIPAHPEEVRYDLIPVTLDGELVMEEYDTEEVETFIVYKDKLYPEGWNGDISAAI